MTIYHCHICRLPLHPEDGKFRHAMPTDHEPDPRPGMEDAIYTCDFCMIPSVVWRYPCEDFNMTFQKDDGSTYVTQFADDWGACDVCSTLIERGDVIGLVTRSLVNQGETDTRKAKYASDVFNAFGLYRTGPREPFDPLEERS